MNNVEIKKNLKNSCFNFAVFPSGESMSLLSVCKAIEEGFEKFLETKLSEKDFDSIIKFFNRRLDKMRSCKLAWLDCEISSSAPKQLASALNNVLIQELAMLTILDFFLYNKLKERNLLDFYNGIVKHIDPEEKNITEIAFHSVILSIAKGKLEDYLESGRFEGLLAFSEEGGEKIESFLMDAIQRIFNGKFEPLLEKLGQDAVAKLAPIYGEISILQLLKYLVYLTYASLRTW